MNNIFETASRLKLRFDISGQISTEQLWDAKMPALVDYEQQLTEVVEGYGKSTRRTRAAKTVAQEINELRLAIVSYVLDVREKEAEEARSAASDKENNQKILALIAEKQDDQLKAMSVDDLKKMLK